MLIRHIAFALVLAMPGAGSATAQLSCPRPPEPSVQLDFKQPGPMIETRRLAELQRMSREGLGEHDQALGLYKTELRTALAIKYATTTAAVQACLVLREAVIEVEFADRRIYLAQELPRGSCQYDVTLAHEQLHARIDDTVLARELPKLKESLHKAATEVGSIGPVPVRDLGSYRDDLNERLQRVFERELDRIAQIRRREQARIDTPESYKRESERCPGGLAVR